MKTELETTKSENIALEGQTQNIDPNAPSSIGGITQNMQNMGASGAAFQASIPEGQGLTTVTGPIQTTTRRIITTTNNVPIENISINNINGTALGTTKTTTTTTTTHYNLGQTEGSNIQMIQGQGGSGMVMGVGGGVEDQAQDIAYSSNTGMRAGAGAAAALGKMTTTTTTTETKYNLGQTQGQIIQREGGGVVMGVGGGVEDNALDATYSSNTGQNLGAAGAKMTTTTTTTKTQYDLGQTQGQIIQGQGAGLVMGVEGHAQDSALDANYSSNTGQGLGAAPIWIRHGCRHCKKNC